MKRTGLNITEFKRRFAAVARAFAKDAQVTRGGRKGFGSGALRVNSKIFAMISSSGEYVLKLPEVRIDELVSGGEGQRFEPRPGRVMKEWVVITSGRADWVGLAKEAYAFVRHEKAR